MSDPVLLETKIRGGVWEGVLRASPSANGSPPQVIVLHNAKPVSGATLAALPDRPGHWMVRLLIPLDSLSDGVQTFSLSLADGPGLGHFSVTVGEDRNEDLRADLALLRAELEVLKRAFRRHCAETETRDMPVTA